MVAGITTFAKSIDQAVEDKLAADPGLKRQWEEVSTRFRFVFADPEAAFRNVDVDTMLKNPDVATSTLAKLTDRPESFGPLKGKTGLFASRADKQDRQRAELNAPALVRDLDRYLRLRAEAERKHEAEERAARHKVSVEIPALSPAATQALERVRDAIDRNDLPAALAFALEDRMVKAELEGFARAVSARFGERSLLSDAAKTPDGPAFETLAAGLNPGQRAELKAAWPALRTAQQLATQQRTGEALKEASTLRQTPGSVAQMTGGAAGRATWTGRRRTVQLLSGGAIVIAAMAAAGVFAGLRINLTPSAPLGSVAHRLPRPASDDR